MNIGKIWLLDKNISKLSNDGINKYKSEITKQKNKPICTHLSTGEVAIKGADLMRKDNFSLIKEKIDV